MTRSALPGQATARRLIQEARRTATTTGYRLLRRQPLHLVKLGLLRRARNGLVARVGRHEPAVDKVLEAVLQRRLPRRRGKPADLVLDALPASAVQGANLLDFKWTRPKTFDVAATLVTKDLSWWDKLWISWDNGVPTELASITVDLRPQETLVNYLLTTNIPLPGKHIFMPDPLLAKTKDDQKGISVPYDVLVTGTLASQPELPSQVLLPSQLLLSLRRHSNSHRYPN